MTSRRESQDPAAGLQSYLVGGAVRDRVLNLEIKDRDYVVVGQTPDAMVARGFLQVGQDFPVFIHPLTGDEYALARTERKWGKGYKGFVFHYSPDVTLEEDLARRDLTINAIAQDAAGKLIDPYGGCNDIREGVLRHVSDAFAEDPLRVLRAARFHARFGFRIADSTMSLMRRIVKEGELGHLATERIWAEISRGIRERKPSRMFVALEKCGALCHITPELSAAWNCTVDYGLMKGMRFGLRAMASADKCSESGLPLGCRFAALLCAAPDSAGDAAILVANVCKSLKVPRRVTRHAEAAIRARVLICRQLDGDGLDCDGLLDLLHSLNWPRDRKMMDNVLQLLEADLSIDGVAGVNELAERLRQAREVLQTPEVSGRIRDMGATLTPGKVRGIRLDALRKAGLGS